MMQTILNVVGQRNLLGSIPWILYPIPANVPENKNKNKESEIYDE